MLLFGLTMVIALQTPANDSHSFAQPDEVRSTHIDIDLTVDFTNRKLKGFVTHKLQRMDVSKPFLVDCKSLVISKVETSSDGKDFVEASYKLGEEKKILGQPLSINLKKEDTYVRIRYHTSQTAMALQWLTPKQTSGKQHPFLFTQSQAINARSWLPLQDSPGVRVTYSANIRITGADASVVPVMSAAVVSSKEGLNRFEMKQPIPSYLIALAVGELKFQALGKRTGVWAEPKVLGKAAREFEDLEAMLLAVEELYGPYRWDRYDVLVLPPSFPFGGMENPRVTFATPTILAGDKSLVSLLAHELAHSWSGNLVTNATWRDFWLNEGFTVYLERRILEKVYGKARAEMEAQLGRQELEKSIQQMKPKEQVLHIDLKDQDPDDNVSDIPYEKGNLFLVHLERVVGREKFDAFLKAWFAEHSFRSVTTSEFVEFLKTRLLNANPKWLKEAKIEEWVNQPGLPASTPRINSTALLAVEKQAKEWQAGTLELAKITFDKWSTQERLHFLRSLSEQLKPQQFDALNRSWKLTNSGNSEIACQALEIGIRCGCKFIDADLKRFLIEVGRRKFVKPLFDALVKTPEGKEKAILIYREARGGYHPITKSTIDELLQWKE